MQNRLTELTEQLDTLEIREQRYVDHIRDLQRDLAVVRQDKADLQQQRVDIMLEDYAEGVDMCVEGNHEYRIIRNPGKVRITGEVPKEYIKKVVTEKEDRAAILRDLKADKKLPFAELEYSYRVDVKGRV